jgi:DNA-binding CsgD family transcriptional regulator/phage shock protein PspC (stress-responsive transcriptional regulator)
MQHLNVFYLFVIALIGIVSLGITTAEYLKTREKILRSYAYFHTALTLLVVSDLLLSYVSLNLSGLHRFLFEFLEYINVFVVQYAVMVTFPLFIHAFFSIPQAKKRNFVFLGLAVILCLAEHVLTFLFQADSNKLLPDNIDNLVLILVVFYGFVTGISEYHHCEPEKARLAKPLLILLGISMPAIIVEALFYDSLPVPLYPIAYCSYSIIFTYHLVQYSFALPQKRTPSLPTETEAERVSEGGTESLLTEGLYRQYNISPREQDVLPLLLQGASNNHIAETLFISLSTVKTHLRNIYAKFDVKNRYELVALLKHGDEALIPRSDADDHD